MDYELLLRLIRKVVERLETKAPAGADQTGDEVQLREMLLALEISLKFRPKPATPKAAVDWSKHLPLLLVLAVILAAVVASALGLDVRGLL